MGLSRLERWIGAAGLLLLALPASGFDPGPPVPLALRVLRPERGSRTSAGILVVTGSLQGGVAPDLFVDGQPVLQGTGGRFAVRLPAAAGMRRITIEAISRGSDARRLEHRGVWVGADAQPGALLRRALRLRLSPAALRALAGLLTDRLAEIDLRARLAEATPGITRLDYDRIEIELAPLAGALEVRLRVHGLQIGFRGRADVGLGSLAYSGTARAQPAEVRARLVPRLDLDRAGVSVEDAEVTLAGFSYDLRGVPGALEGWLRPRVRRLAEGAIEAALGALTVPDLLNPRRLTRRIEIGGRPLRARLAIRSVEIDPDGVVIALDVGVRAEAPVPWAAGGALPPRSDAALVLDPLAEDVELAISWDLIDRLLHAAWAAGLLDVTLGSGAVDRPSIFQPTLAMLSGVASLEGAPLSTPLHVRLHPLLPPTARSGPTGLRLRWLELQVEVRTPAGPLLTLALDLRADLALPLALDTHRTPQVVAVAHADLVATYGGAAVEAADLTPLAERLIAALPGWLPPLSAPHQPRLQALTARATPGGLRLTGRIAP